MSKSGIPNNYFNNLNQRIKDGINSTPDNLKENSPLLYDMRSLNGFKVPSSYFENLENDLLKIISNGKTKTIKLKSWLMTTAAGLLIVATSMFIFLDLEHVEYVNQVEFAFSDAYDFYESNLDDLDMAFLSELETDQGDLSIEDFKDEELEEYLSLIIDDFTDSEIEDLY